MRAPLSWLQALAPLRASATDRASVADLAAELDALGLVVESVEHVGEGLGDVVLAEVKAIAPISGADRIRKVVVDAGGGAGIEVVCGAWNFSIGDVVGLAPVGAELPGGFRIGRRKMKGVVSNGMLCSGRELRLSGDAEGILVLGRAGPGGPELGRPLAEHLAITPDVVFDLAIEPNRPDCLCMLGVARDLAARLRLPLLAPEPEVVESGPPAAELASVKVESPELCGRLAARVLTGVSSVPSTVVVQRRLMLAGMRPVDAVVDASNYVMLELGQPTHPYDLRALGGGGLGVRAARPGEVIVTLDGEERTLGTRPARPGEPLSALDCLICDVADQPVGIGGVMGGRSSEITEATKSVLLEVAQFLPAAVGRTARHLGLRTEASTRFERGVDPGGVERAALRVCELVAEAAAAAGANAPVVAPGLVDDHPVRIAPTRLSVRTTRVNGLLGTDLSADDIAGLLEPIGYVRGDGSVEKAVELSVPSFRPDVVAEVDVIEDVARTFGYRNIARTQRRSPFVGRLDDRQQLRRRLRWVLAGLGAHEAWTSSIADPAAQARAGHVGEPVRLSNPMAAEESVLRSGLLAGLLGALAYNSGHRHAFLRLFELGDVFAAGGDASGPVEEQERLGLLLAHEHDDARTAAHAWRVVSDALGVAGVELVQVSPGPDGASGSLPGLHPTRTGELFAAGVAGSSPGHRLAIGAVGEVDPEVVAAFGLAN